MKDRNYKPQCQSDELEFKTIMQCLGIMIVSVVVMVGGVFFIIKCLVSN